MTQNILLSVVLISYNEEGFIGNALESVDFCDEIILVDSGSVDKTREIASKYTKKIFVRPFTDFSTQKNFAIEQARGEWILLLDADEMVDTHLKTEIQQIITQNTSLSGYWIYRANWFMGKQMNYCGFQTDKVLRLIKNGKGKYSGLVHEQMNVNGDIGYLKNRLHHFTYRSIDHYIQKLNDYAALQAKELKIKSSPLSLYHFIIKPTFRFFQHYIIRKGFLDGVPGFVYSFSQFYAVLMRYIKYWLLKKKLK